jgi:Ca2+-binding EF-hand superfamily protein
MRRKIAALALASASILAPLAAHAQMPSPETIFKAWDKDADGFVTKDEWVAAGRKEERFAMVDTNSDGKITVDELKAAMAKMQARRQQQGDQPAAPPPADH